MLKIKKLEKKKSKQEREREKIAALITAVESSQNSYKQQYHSQTSHPVIIQSTMDQLIWGTEPIAFQLMALLISQD